MDGMGGDGEAGDDFRMRLLLGTGCSSWAIVTCREFTATEVVPPHSTDFSSNDLFLVLLYK